MRKLTLDDVTQWFVPETEYDAPDGHFDNPDDIKWINEQLQRGNQAAWFCAKVFVQFRTPAGPIESDPQYLGACSYKSFDDFTKEQDGYYMQMVNEALNNLNAKLEALQSKLGE